MPIDLKTVLADREVPQRDGNDLGGLDLSGTYARPAAIVAPGVNGVVGDGVVDDRAAIQALITAVEAATDQGGTIMFAPGVYQIGTTGLVTTGPGIHLRGSGMGELTGAPSQGGTILRAKTSGTTLAAPLITIGGDASSVSGMLLDGGAVGTCDGILIDSAIRVHVHDVYIRDVGGDGISVGDTAAAYGNRINDVYIQACGAIGIYLRQFGFDTQISDVWIGECVGAGVRMDSGAQSVTNLHVWECADGVQVRSEANRFVNVYLETNVADGMDIFNVDSTSVVGGVCRANGTHGVHISGGDRHRIVGMACYNNGSSGIIVDGDRNEVIGNNCYDDQGTKTQDYGVRIFAGTGNVVVGNVARDADHNTAGFLDEGTLTDFRDKNSTPGFVALSPTIAYKSPNSTPAALVANTAHYIPFVLDRPTAINRVIFEVGTSSGNVNVGIYDNDGTGGAPGTQLAESGSTACPATGGAGIAVSPGVLPPGRYYAALVADNATATFRFSGVSLTVNGVGLAAYTQASVFDLPATAGATVSTGANQFQVLAAVA